jgi:hypothetical protein
MLHFNVVTNEKQICIKKIDPELHILSIEALSLMIKEF